MSHSPVCKNGKHCFTARTRVAPLTSSDYWTWLNVQERMIMIILMVILLLLLILLLLRSYRWGIILRCVARYILRCLFCDKARGWNDSQYFKLVLHIDKCQEISCGTNATCTNTKVSLRCTCNTGFYGDGYNCTGKPVSLLTRLKAIAKDSNSWSLSEKTLKYDVYWCAIRSGIFSLPLAYYYF